MFLGQLFKKTASSFDAAFNPGPEPGDSMLQVFLRQFAEPLTNGLLQAVEIGVWACINHSLKCAPHEIIEGIQVGGGGGPNVLPPVRSQVLVHPLLSNLGGVGGGAPSC